LLDWDYYKERLAGTIQKIVTIPAALQKCQNPLPEIPYPSWLHKRIQIQNDRFKQKTMENFFKAADIEELAAKRKNFAPVNTVVKAEEKQQQHFKLEDCPAPE
jgi:DNA polymerase epsilon subunit 1